MKTEKPPKSPTDSDSQRVEACAAPTGSAYVVRVTRLSVVPPKEPLFSEQCTHIRIVDEAAGEYLEIEQQSGHVGVKSQTIMVSPEEWPHLKQAVETLLFEIKQNNLLSRSPR